eukprot:COSAG02_NODE_38968_length_422_cov_1.281734_1_plen_27_part_10
MASQPQAHGRRLRALASHMVVAAAVEV